MSTSSAVAAAWQSAIFGHASIQAITAQIYAYDIADDSSEAATSQFFDGQEINFLQYLVGRSHKFGETAQTLGSVVTYNYEVQISYFRQAEENLTGTNWQAVRDIFETIFPLVVSELGNTWDSTVDFWSPQAGMPAISQITIDDRQVWRGTYSYFAEKRTTL